MAIEGLASVIPRYKTFRRKVSATILYVLFGKIYHISSLFLFRIEDRVGI
jgi:hypothetical protein